MISGNLQAQWQKLHHSIFVQLHKFAVFSREHERWRVPKIHKSEVAVGMQFAIKHSRNFASIFFTYTKCVTSCNRMGQTQVDVFKQLRRRRSVMIEFGEHESMKRIVDSRRNLRGN